MPRALLMVLVLLLTPPAWAGDEPPKKDPKKERAALVTAACGPGAPVLLVRKPRGTGGEQPEGAAEPPDILDSGDGCEDRIGSLSGDVEVALRPEGAMTPDAVNRAFTGARKLDDLAATLTRASEKLKNPDVTTADILNRMFDNALGRPERTQDPAQALRKTLTDTLAVAANPPGDTKTLTVTPPVKKGPVVGKVPPPKLPDWYDPALPPDQVTPLANPAGPQKSDGQWWPIPSRTGPGPGAFPPNNTPIPATGPHQDTTAASGTPIWAPFIAVFDKCAKKVMGNDSCKPYNFGIYRPSAMCHGVSRAIDVHAMKCADGIHTALQNGKFAEVTLCIKNEEGRRSNPEVRVIWHQCFMGPACTPFNVTQHHYDHGHFSIGCGMGRW